MIAIVVIAIVGGVVYWQSLSRSDATQRQARDNVMTYIQTHHNETAQLMQNMQWTGGRVDTQLVGAEVYVYTTLKSVPGSAGWTVTLDFPVVANPTYTVTVNFIQSGVLEPAIIIWEGTWIQNGTVTETKYQHLVTDGTPYWIS